MLKFPEAKLPEDVDYQIEYREHVVANTSKLRTCEVLVEYLVGCGRYVIVLTERVKHLEILSDYLEKIPHRLAYGDVNKSFRAEAMKEFEKGKIRLIIANKVFRKGVNIKRVDTIIDVAEMFSKNDAQQKFGRGVRIHQDKDELLYISFGTQGDNRFHKAAKSRIRALKKLGIEVTVKDVTSPDTALKAVQAYIQKRKLRCQPDQPLKLALG